jgi:hypothetical protein
MPWSLAFDLLVVIDSLRLQLATQASEWKKKSPWNPN